MFIKERNEGLPPSLKHSYFGCHTWALNLILTDKVNSPKGGKLGGKSGFVGKCQHSILHGNGW